MQNVCTAQFHGAKMRNSYQWKPILLITVGCLVVIAACSFGAGISAWGICGALLAQSSVLFLLKTSPQTPDGPEQEFETRREEFEQWQESKTASLQIEAERLQEKSIKLAAQSARILEFSEYPIADDKEISAPDPNHEIRLSEQDRDVNRILEQEGERVYEAIRNNKYTASGEIDVQLIRTEVFDLIQRVARVYSPESSNPLLETSFEQIARAASRVCLHSLVLVEQLPVDVKHYNINEIYGYVRKAVQSYGAYKQVSPWLKHLSRGAYAGRFAAGANPVSLGAWWLATEVTRRGTQKLVENVVDRQAVAALHDIVAIMGVEVANVYGKGFRQRDPAWVFGSELTELLHRFPMSRESLSQGLQEITKLQLRSEYDRIYLYRCLAQGRSAGMRLSDPAMLTREERESIAAQLESFFSRALHGIDETEKNKWKTDVESRLDLKMKLGHPLGGSASIQERAKSTVRSLHSFLVSIVNLPVLDSISLVENSELMLDIDLGDRASVIERLATEDQTRFEPPDLDPSSAEVDSYLKALFECSIASGNCSEQVEQLLIETGAYFRRSREESIDLLDQCFRNLLDRRMDEAGQFCKLPGNVVRVLLGELKPNEAIIATYDDISQRSDTQLTELPNGRLIAIKSAEGEARAIVIAGDQNCAAVWESDSTVTTNRIKGYLVDDCELSGGNWKNGHKTTVVVSGSMTGGGFRRMFGALLSAFSQSG